MCDTSTLNFNSILNKFAAVAWSQFSFFDATDVSSDMKSMKSVKIKINRLKERVCWSIQSISIKSDLPIFIDWLLRDHCQHLAAVTGAKGTRPAATVPQLCRRNGSRPCCRDLSCLACNDTLRTDNFPWVRSIGKSGFRFSKSKSGFPNRTRNPKKDFTSEKSVLRVDFN